jgi:hypothetical protein
MKVESKLLRNSDREHLSKLLRQENLVQAAAVTRDVSVLQQKITAS